MTIGRKDRLNLMIPIKRRRIQTTGNVYNAIQNILIFFGPTHQQKFKIPVSSSLSSCIREDFFLPDFSKTHFESTGFAA
jgi:hypothetical protein